MILDWKLSLGQNDADLRLEHEPGRRASAILPDAPLAKFREAQELRAQEAELQEAREKFKQAREKCAETRQAIAKRRRSPSEDSDHWSPI